MGCKSSALQQHRARNSQPKAEKCISEVIQRVNSSELRLVSIKSGGIARSQFIFDVVGEVSQHYDLDKKMLGEGSFGSVRKAWHKATGEIRAIKSILKSAVRDLERLSREVAIMKAMDHPNIVKLFEMYEDKQSVHLCMELCTGGELFDRVISEGRFTEVDAAFVMQQILRAVYYMHENRVCHRDLKPENFLFLDNGPIDRSLLKLIDFGLSCQFSEDKALTTKMGTPYFIAPEVLSCNYSNLCDLWSCGVIMYILLVGYPPFNGKDDDAVMKKVESGKLKFATEDWKNISEDAKELVRGLLTRNPRERCNAAVALGHKWVMQHAPKAAVASLQEGFLENLRSFRSHTHLKKAALLAVAHHLQESDIKSLRDTFMALDENGDGQLTVHELKAGLKRTGMKIPSDLQKTLENVDSNGSGVIDYTEFIAAALNQKLYHQRAVCWKAFMMFDRDGDGKLSPDEIRRVLSSGELGEEMAPLEDAEDIIAEVDTNGDGHVDFEEFLQMMRAPTRKLTDCRLDGEHSERSFSRSPSKTSYADESPRPHRKRGSSRAVTTCWSALVLRACGGVMPASRQRSYTSIR